ncbi:MAG: hypothetical protein BRD30_01960 [Bacteroidetes bacterium QH_2_63_10]|nr:MAG: hypothetical protein BRD30_01960 [Bacteroidetes bacterium QH_2_63_10]
MSLASWMELSSWIEDVVLIGRVDVNVIYLLDHVFRDRIELSTSFRQGLIQGAELRPDFAGVLVARLEGHASIAELNGRR